MSQHDPISSLDFGKPEWWKSEQKKMTTSKCCLSALISGPVPTLRGTSIMATLSLRTDPKDSLPSAR